jgi:hypothetical protein
MGVDNADATGVSIGPQFVNVDLDASSRSGGIELDLLCVADDGIGPSEATVLGYFIADGLRPGVKQQGADHVVGTPKLIKLDLRLVGI